MPKPPTRKQQQERRETLRPHHTRDEIVDIMRSYGRPISPTRLSEVTNKTIGSVAYHVRILVAAGVIELADEGRVRGAIEHFYSLVPSEQEAQLVDPIHGVLGLCGALTVPAPDGGYPRPATLDDHARAQLHSILDKLKPQVQAIVAGAALRTAS